MEVTITGPDGRRHAITSEPLRVRHDREHNFSEALPDGYRELAADPHADALYIRTLRYLRRLDRAQAEALDRLLGGLPPFGRPVGEPPDLTEEWRWAPAGDEGTWGSEKAMQLAIRDHQPTGPDSGFPRSRSPNARCRGPATKSTFSHLA